jgi:3-phosphoshikimate 1-carboxyvinyltransferase
MEVIIQPSVLKGTIHAPASKSSMQRACAAALLRKGETLIQNPGHSNDDLAALQVIRDLGAIVEKGENGSLLVISQGVNPVVGTLNCGESGLGIRMFAPIAALSEKGMTITGVGSLLKRPMGFFDELFPKLGVEVLSNKGRLPLKIKGPLRPRNIEIDGSLSSQFLTGLLMVYAAAGAGDLSIRVRQLTSKPYIDLTLQIMKHFGWEVDNRDYEEFHFGGPSGTGERKPASRSLPLTGISYTVEGDWSSGAFLLVAGAIAGRITVKGLDSSSAQADKAVLSALKDSGAALSVETDGIRIGPGSLKAFHFKATDCPDLFPPLVALASYCDGMTILEGVHRLAHKESDRARTLQEEFAKMGVDIRIQDDLMMIKGAAGLRGALVHSRHDHRIAMACAVAGLGAKGDTCIEEAQAVNKSYPGFYEDIKSLQPFAERKY